MADDRPYLSVGEVLELLRTDFPELSIAKVREFESEGHLRPERTASGYRKFYDDDIARLRVLLSPVSAALSDVEPPAVVAHDDAAVAEAERRHPASYRQLRRRGRSDHEGAAAGLGARGAVEAATVSLASQGTADAIGSAEVRPAPVAPARLAVVREPRAGRGDAVAGKATVAASAPPPDTALKTTVEVIDDAEPVMRGASNPLLTQGTGVSLSLTELATAAAADPALIRELEQYGLVSGRAVFGSTIYDEDALLVTRAAAAFARHGVEPRHLRLYRSLAERELAFFEQVLSPQIHHRSGDSRQRAGELLGDLVRLGEQLRTATVRVAARASIEHYRSGG